jgi:hypothetical protein
VPLTACTVQYGYVPFLLEFAFLVNVRCRQDTTAMYLLFLQSIIGSWQLVGCSVLLVPCQVEGGERDYDYFEIQYLANAALLL